MSVALDYKIISEQGTKALVEEVKKAMAEKWQPLGGHSVITVINPTTGKGIVMYSQSLVKY